MIHNVLFTIQDVYEILFGQVYDKVNKCVSVWCVSLVSRNAQCFAPSEKNVFCIDVWEVGPNTC